MTPQNAANEIKSIKAQNAFYRLTTILVLGMCMMLIILCGYLTLKETVKIVPAEVRRPYELGADYANKEYLIDMANYVLDKVLTVTPELVDYNNKVILKMAHPDGYGPLKSTLEAAGLRIKKDKLSTIWSPDKEEVNEGAKTVIVNGKIQTFVADTRTSTKERKYLVQFDLTSSGRLYVTKIQEIVRPDPSAAPAKPD